MSRPAVLVALGLGACASTSNTPATGALQQHVPGTSVSIAMLPVPGTRIRLAATEIPWEVYDAFVFGFDKKDRSVPSGVDAIVRPSQPYITMDHSFGHAGYPVISISAAGASSFCAWLSAATGKKYRLPTEAEWEAAARADGGAADLDATAWTQSNSGAKTHPIGSKAPNAWGFHDLLGNAAEWCTSANGAFVVRGGSYRDGPEGANAGASVPANPAWNKSDPQIPKSRWWLADGGFIGFRIACEE
ncbi:MAG TPA: SUMF1/EgtB/PvdO family nonheme iron enzyme [Planctomycetota bacterium]|jgi:formylglycine-generating enzyme required for sulfatase activity|nr:SUMF1/EgtB/PvdO family nonheme iron enzyme [Planctomycetota bacterium]